MANPDAIDDIGLSTNEDIALTISPTTLLANDTDADPDDTLSILSVQDAVNGSVELIAGDVVFTPDPNYNGPASFTYTISDGNGGTDTASVSITVEAVDDLPAAADDAVTTQEDTAIVAGNLAGNDTPSGDGGNVWALDTGASNGTAVVNADGTYDYTPNANFNGADSFSYTLTDVDGDVSTATVNITVEAVDDLPAAADDAVTTQEDTAIVAGNLAGNDTPSGDGGNVWALDTGASNGTAVVNADGTYDYTPNANFNGADSFSYTLTDVDGDVSTATVNITVEAVDDLPAAADDAVTTQEDTAIVAGNLAGNDTPSGDGGNVWALDTGASNGTAVVNADGTYDYTPNANFNGADSFSYTLTDVDGDVSTATVNITVEAVDDLPAAADDAVTTQEDTAIVAGNLAGNDTPSGDGGNVWALDTGASNGTAVVNADGTYDYTPNANFNGADSFSYTLTDVDGDVSTATVNITVEAVDDLPAAADDAVTTQEDTAIVAGNLAGNDTPSGDGGNVWALDTGASNGTAVVNADGTYDYTPNANFNGADSFSYTLTDVDGDVSTATVNITVEAVDDLPAAADDAVTTQEDTAIVAGNLAGNDTPSGDGGNVWALDTGASNGTAVVNADGTYDYTPNANFNGADSFSYTLTDVDGDVSTATVNITVEAVDDLPAAADDAVTTQEDTAIVAGNLAGNDTPSGDGGNVWALDTGASNGTAVVNADGTYDYTPNANFNGADSFSYTLTDVDGDVSTATVNITVEAVDDLPAAADDAVTTQEDTAIVAGNLAGNDTPSGDGGNVWALDTGASNGTAVVNADGTYDYTPNANFNGADSFSYTLTDVDGDVSTATVNITVEAVDDLPAAADDAVTTQEDTAIVAGNLAGNDTPSGDGGNVWALDTGASNGTAVVNADGTYDYTPNANFNGADSFSYTLTDVDGDVSTATVNITVEAVDDLPAAADDAVTTQEDTAIVAGNLAGNDTPSGDGGNVWALDTGASNGTAVVNADGTYDYTPNANFNGADSFSYTLTDVDGDVSTATVNITVEAVDDLPAAADDAVTTQEDTAIVAGNLAGNDTPSGDGGNVWALDTGASNGTAVVNADGTYDYTPNANFNGADSFSYTLTDVDGDVSTATVNITVEAVDDLPAAADDAVTTQEDTAIVAGNLAGNDTPSGDGGNVWALDTGASNGTAVVNADGTYDYTPNANFNGADSFSYTLTDVDGDVSTATVNITVEAVDDLPAAADDAVTTQEDTAIVAGNLAGNDTPSGDGGNVWALDTGASNGTAVVNADGTYDYTPNANFNGADSFSYTLTDVDGDVSTATVNITVEAVDDLPAAADDAVTTQEDTAIVAGNLAGNDTPSGDGGNVWALDTGASNGTAVVNADGTYDYTPNANFNGADSFSYTLTDVDGDVSTATVNITVEAVDDLPAAADDAVTTQEDTAIVAGNLAGNDTPSGDGGNVWALDTGASNGTAVVNADGTYDYTPNANFNGADSFSYTLTDVDGDVSTATVNITVEAVDDLPAAADDAVTTQEDTAIVAGNLAGNDTPSGDGGNVWALDTGASNGTAVVNADGTYDYTPNANFNGADSFSYTLTDVDGDVSTATVNITVEAVDDLPAAADDAVTTQEDTAIVAGNLAGNDTPSGDGGNVWALDTGASNGTAVVNADGTYDYTPNANFNGADSFSYTLTDVDGDVSTATVNITVEAVDDLPAAADDAVTTQEDTAIVAGNLAGNDTPSGDGGNVWALDTGASNGTAVVNADGTYDYTPNANFNGADSFSYTLTDVDGDVSTATVNITVEAVDDPVDANFDTGTVDVEAKSNNNHGNKHGHNGCNGNNGGNNNDNSALIVDAAHGVLANDTGDDPLQVSAVNGNASNVGNMFKLPSGAMLTLNEDGSYEYDPSTLSILKQVSSDTTIHDVFSYTATDADGDSETTIVDITVNIDGNNNNNHGHNDHHDNHHNHHHHSHNHHQHGHHHNDHHHRHNDHHDHHDRYAGHGDHGGHQNQGHGGHGGWDWLGLSGSSQRDIFDDHGSNRGSSHNNSNQNNWNDHGSQNNGHAQHHDSHGSSGAAFAMAQLEHGAALHQNMHHH